MNTRAALAPLSLLVLAMLVSAPARAVDPHRSYERLVTGNGFAMASYDIAARRIDTFLERPYRFHAPRNDPPDLCFAADESRDLAYDTYFGVRASDGQGVTAEWLPDTPLEEVGYEAGTGILRARHRLGPSSSLVAETFAFAPMEHAAPALVQIVRVENTGSSSITASLYALFNFHLGAANGGREPSAANEQAAYDGGRRTIYEYSDDSQGTMAYVALSPLAHVTASTGEQGVYPSLLAGADLNDDGNAGPTADVAPGMQSLAFTLAPGESAWFATAAVWALDEDAAPDVDALLGWVAGRTPEELLAGERSSWSAWHTPPPAGLDAAQQDLWRHSAALLRMSQVREPGRGHGQILASLPPGLGDVNAQWNISWVRDMAYAVVGLARAGHLEEAKDALIFQLTAGPGRHVDKVGRPYRVSITRYFGNGDEESDCNAFGPNIEFDGFGLFLWSLGEWVRAGGDVDELRPYWSTVRDEIADVLVSLRDEDGVIRADSSIWEVHWNGQQRRFTYTSLAAARGLCEAAELASLLGETDDAARYALAGAAVRDAVVALHTDADGVLAQSREELELGMHYVDAATVEAINWGIVDPQGLVAGATLQRLFQDLTVPSGRGLMRNDDGGDYDSQEWVFVDLRLVPALRATGDVTRANELLGWVESQALANDLQIAELFDRSTGDYRGSIPMAGFGAGLYLVAHAGDALPPACGAYAPEPNLVDAGPDAGLPADGGGDAGLVDAGLVDAGRDDAGLVDAGLDGGALDDGGLARDGGDDAGPAGDDAGAAADAGATEDAGGDQGGDAKPDGGPSAAPPSQAECGCSASSSGPLPHGAALLVIGLAALIHRRRRRLRATL